jgi:exopolysaccharide biosynthesis protein
VKKRIPVVWLVVLDFLLIAAGAGAFYLFLGVLPQPYEVVAVPTRPARPTAAIVALVSSPPPTATLTARLTSTIEPTRTPAPSATPARRTTTSVAAAGPPSPAATLPATAPAPPAATAEPTQVPATATPRPTVTKPAATKPPAATAVPATTPAASSGGLGNGKFSDRFTNGDVVRTATTYQSPDINVTLSKVQRKGVTYYVQDIYVRYTDNLRTAFARNTYGRQIAGWPVDIANANGAIGAINGDWYGTGVPRAVIRNGVLYNGRAEGDVAVLFSDGTMKVYPASEFNAQQVMAAGAYQAWDFGPGLLTPEGKAIGKFSGGIAGLNPRTAIGYFEPGHYALVVVDGRQPGYSNGMTLAQLATLFEELGCKAAYNLDGGQTSQMVWGGQLANHPYRGGRPASDIIFVGE